MKRIVHISDYTIQISGVLHKNRTHLLGFTNKNTHFIKLKINMKFKSMKNRVFVLKPIENKYFCIIYIFMILRQPIIET